MAAVQFKFPKTLAGCADALFSARLERLGLQKSVDDIKKRETLLKEYLISNLPKSEASGVAGKLARVTIVTKLVPQVEDWDSLYAYIKKNGAWELLQRRLGETAVKERWEAGKTVPGVVAFQMTDVSVNKV